MTLAEIKKRNREAGYVWFEPETMKFWRTKLPCKTVYSIDGSHYFITQDGQWDGTMAYTIRRQNETGSISTFGEFGAYKTLEDAQDALERTAK